MSATVEHREQPQYIAAGQRWTFVTTDGAHREYVLDRTEHEPGTPGVDPEDQRPSSIAWLLNPTNGKFAMVSHYWLRQGVLPGRAHWLPPVVGESGGELS